MNTLGFINYFHFTYSPIIYQFNSYDTSIEISISDI